MAHLRQTGVFVGGVAVARGADDTSAIGGAVQPQDAVVIERGETLDRTGIHTQQRRGGHEGAQGDVDLVGGPPLDVLTAGAIDQILLHHLSVEGQLLSRHAAHRAGDVDQLVQVGWGDLALHQEHHQVRGIGDLALVPGVGPQLRPQGSIGDHQKLPGLQPIARRAHHQTVLQRRPGGGVDPTCGIKGFHRIAPAQGRIQGARGEGGQRDLVWGGGHGKLKLNPAF
jgi:hypothetical protein